MANALSPLEQSHAEVRDPAARTFPSRIRRDISPQDSSTGVPIASANGW